MNLGRFTYTYDPLGRQTLIPAGDTTNPAAGNITVVYDHTDAARTITQDTTGVAFTLDGAGRRLQQTTTVDGVTSGVLTRHYTDSGDNPAWSVDTSSGQSVTTRYAALTGDGLGVTFTSTPTSHGAELTLTGLRGDIAATVTLDGDTPAGGIGSWTEYTEYGQPTTTNPPPTGTSVTPVGYGWLGGHERATLTGMGITLMGVRLYNQASALFTSADPIYGGNATAYGYPDDPVNAADLSGALYFWWNDYWWSVGLATSFSIWFYISGWQLRIVSSGHIVGALASIYLQLKIEGMSTTSILRCTAALAADARRARAREGALLVNIHYYRVLTRGSLVYRLITIQGVAAG